MLAFGLYCRLPRSLIEASFEPTFQGNDIIAPVLTALVLHDTKPVAQHSNDDLGTLISAVIAYARRTKSWAGLLKKDAPSIHLVVVDWQAESGLMVVRLAGANSQHQKPLDEALVEDVANAAIESYRQANGTTDKPTPAQDKSFLEFRSVETLL